ncbi:YihY/virulence factor BrkB family protein [Flavobacterium sp.]|uniref:YihY/virulence factor BrkB family protein n=1 Tax=Flavobacterium sp. TaxID=239 RepID=UPI002625FF4C|nr:YihY/virulence factor BrkB family protein [Flavobacterium sp.]MDD2986905.1 YihY/virulence factor BrkB family protein [Flavobacterium sp.]
MSFEIEQKIDKIPIINQLVRLTKKIKLPWLEGLSFYDLMELYIIGIAKGAFSYRAGAIAFSFFMALFPFALFILNLIPYIPIEGFEKDFLRFVEEGVPPNTFEAIKAIIDDILNNSYKGLLSSGFILSIFLMSNGLNAILGGFETSYHISINRSFIRQYFIALLMSLLFSIILIVTIVAILISEIIIQDVHLHRIWDTDTTLIEMIRYGFVVLMILITTSMLFKFGTKEVKRVAFISIGSVFTTLLIMLSSYIFGIYVVKFAKYNELYGSIGTLLILMFYIWINCMILLLGFELNATIHKLKRKNLFD